MAKHCLHSLVNNREVLLHLWDNSRTSIMLVKLIAVPLARALDTRTASLLRAYLHLSTATLECFSERVASADSKQAERAAPVLLSAARAIVRSGTFHALGHILARGTVDSGSMAAAAAAAQPTAPCPCMDAVSAQLSPPTALQAVKSIMQLATAGGSRDDRLLTQTLTALRESQLLSHTAKLMAAGACDWDAGANATGIAGLLADFDLWPRARALGLPGRCMSHVLTMAAVEALRRLEGGPAYGMPPEAAQAAVRLLKYGVAAAGADDGRVAHYTLYAWVLHLAPGYGLPPPSDRTIGAKAVYTLSMAAAGASVRYATDGGLDAGPARSRVHSGTVSSSGASGGHSARVSPGASGGSARGRAGAPDSGAIHTPSSFACSTAALALLSAHDALVRMRQRRAGAGAMPQAGAAATAHAQVSGPRGTVGGNSGTAAEGEDATSQAGSGAIGRVSGSADASEYGLARPLDWWSSGVKVLCAVTSESMPLGGGLWRNTGRLLCCQMDGGQLATPMPGLLPSLPPPDLAAALAAGYPACLERLLRRRWEPFAVYPEYFASLLSWPRLGWLLAYGEPRQAAALVATIGKVMGMLYFMSSDTVAAQALAGMVVGCSGFLDRGFGWLRSRQNTDAPAPADAGSASGSNGDGGGGGGGGGSGCWACSAGAAGAVGSSASSHTGTCVSGSGGREGGAEGAAPGGNSGDGGSGGSDSGGGGNGGSDSGGGGNGSSGSGGGGNGSSGSGGACGRCGLSGNDVSDGLSASGSGHRYVGGGGGANSGSCSGAGAGCAADTATAAAHSPNDQLSLLLAYAFFAWLPVLSGWCAEQLAAKAAAEAETLRLALLLLTTLGEQLRRQDCTLPAEEEGKRLRLLARRVRISHLLAVLKPALAKPAVPDTEETRQLARQVHAEMVSLGRLMGPGGGVTQRDNPDREEGQGEGTGTHAPRPPPAAAPPLPSLGQTRSLLRTCANLRCINMEGYSEAGLPLRECPRCRALVLCAECQEAHVQAGCTAGDA